MDKLIFFNGWGMDERIITALDDGREVIVVAPEADMALLASLTDQCRGQNLTVVAWSMGVWAANRWLCTNGLEPMQTIAINGTPFGIDDQRGIAQAVFAKTATHWCEQTQRKFYQRVFTALGEPCPDYQTRLPVSNLQAQKQALNTLLAQVNTVTTIYPWQHAWIARGDRIFLPTQQRAAWLDTPTQVHEVEGAHDLLARWPSWQALLEECR